MDPETIRNALLSEPSEKSSVEAVDFARIAEEHADLLGQVAVRVPCRVTDSINPRLACILGAWSKMTNTHWDPLVDDHGGFIERLRAKMVWDFLNQEDLKKFKYLVMIDNDMEPDLDLVYCMARWDKPMVGVRAMMVHADIGPMLNFTVRDEGGLWRFPSLKALLQRKMKVPTLGLTEVGHVGTGAVCIRRDVLESFTWDTPEEVPFMVPDHIRMEAIRYGELRMGEDIWFCNQVRRKGFKIYVDNTTEVGHRKAMILYLDKFFKSADVDPETWVLPMDGVVLTAE